MNALSINYIHLITVEYLEHGTITIIIKSNVSDCEVFKNLVMQHLKKEEVMNQIMTDSL